MTSGLGSPPQLATGYGWQRPPDGRLAHIVPTGKNFTLCGLITDLTDEPWPRVFDADFANDVDWCRTCGDHVTADRDPGPTTAAIVEKQAPLPPAPSGHSWRIPDTASPITHLVPDGGGFTVCGMALGDKSKWHKVLGVDEENVPWDEECYRLSKESLGASVWIAVRPEDVVAQQAERRLNGSRTPEEIRRTLAELDARMSTDRRGTTPALRSGPELSGHQVVSGVVLRPPKRSREQREEHDHDHCVICAQRPHAMLTAGGTLEPHPAWFTSIDDYRRWIAAGWPKHWESG
jgi:hypothetical protein